MAGCCHTAAPTWSATRSTGATNGRTDGFEGRTVIGFVNLIGGFDNSICRNFRGSKRRADWKVEARANRVGFQIGKENKAYGAAGKHGASDDEQANTA